MDKQRQRLAIAEQMGWRFYPNEDLKDVIITFVTKNKNNIWGLDPNGELRFQHAIPDYLNDLNAMHEVEKTLQHCDDTGSDLGEFIDRLVDLSCEAPSHPSGYGTAVSATAAQRAEAFLRTIGKWEISLD